MFFARFTDEKKAAASASHKLRLPAVEPSPSLQLHQASLQKSFGMGHKWEDKDPRSDEKLADYLSSDLQKKKKTRVFGLC